MATTPQQAPTGCSYYTDPETGKAKCSFCGHPMKVTQDPPRIGGLLRQVEVMCQTAGCRGVNAVGQVQHHNVPAQRHRQRSAS
jgi:hypothetical protein